MARSDVRGYRRVGCVLRPADFVKLILIDFVEGGNRMPEPALKVKAGWFLMTFALLLGRRAVACAVTMAVASCCSGATFVVSNVNDSGAGSLRQAILDANSTPGLDTIAFQLVGSFTITPSSALPSISDPVIIDGTTQPGFVSGGPPIVELN